MDTWEIIKELGFNKKIYKKNLRGLVSKIHCADYGDAWTYGEVDQSTGRVKRKILATAPLEHASKKVRKLFRQLYHEGARKMHSDKGGEGFESFSAKAKSLMDAPSETALVRAVAGRDLAAFDLCSGEVPLNIFLNDLRSFNLRIDHFVRNWSMSVEGYNIEDTEFYPSKWCIVVCNALKVLMNHSFVIGSNLGVPEYGKLTSECWIEFFSFFSEGNLTVPVFVRLCKDFKTRHLFYSKDFGVFDEWRDCVTYILRNRPSKYLDHYHREFESIFNN